MAYTANGQGISKGSLTHQFRVCVCVSFRNQQRITNSSISSVRVFFEHPHKLLKQIQDLCFNIYREALAPVIIEGQHHWCYYGQGYVEIYLELGAVFANATCGPCVGTHLGGLTRVGTHVRKPLGPVTF
jgi:hypothetical protein